MLGIAMDGSRSSEQNNNGGDDQGEEMNLFLKVSKTVAISVKKSGTVRNVKEALKGKEGISECIQDLSYSGEWLRDDRKLVECSIQPNATLHVLVQNYVPLKLLVKGPSHHDTIVVEARSCDTIQTVKSSIMAKKGMQLCNFCLIYAGKHLADDGTLASLNIQGGSTLRMMTMPKDTLTISVKMPKGEILNLEAKVFYTVWAIKIVVASLVDIPIDNLCLFYNGVQLDCSKNLSCYNITEESLLEMMVRQSFQVFVRDFSGKTVTVNVHLNDLVKNVKIKLFLKLRVPIDFQKLYFEGAYLDDDRDVASYNISKDSTLHLRV